MVYKVFDKNISGYRIEIKIISNKELAGELQKLIIRKFKKRNVQSTFIEYIWSIVLADMQLISKFNKGFRFLIFNF